MTMKTQTITREHVVALALSMPIEKLIRWYEYGIFIQNSPSFIVAMEEQEADLQAELAGWEAASDEDWLTIEQQMQEAI